jgi:hypothetical protein
MVDANGRAELLNCKQAAHFLKVHRSTIHGWKRSGRLSNADAWPKDELLAARRNLPPAQAKRLKGDATPDTSPDAAKASEKVEPAPAEPTSSDETPPATTETDPTPPAEQDAPRVKLADHPEDLELPMAEKKPDADTTKNDPAKKVETPAEKKPAAKVEAPAAEKPAPATYFDYLADEGTA